MHSDLNKLWRNTAAGAFITMNVELILRKLNFFALIVGRYYVIP